MRGKFHVDMSAAATAAFDPRERESTCIAGESSYVITGRGGGLGSAVGRSLYCLGV
jgi:hypothetical protein